MLWNIASPLLKELRISSAWENRNEVSAIMKEPGLANACFNEFENCVEILVDVLPLSVSKEWVECGLLEPRLLELVIQKAYEQAAATEEDTREKAIFDLTVLINNILFEAYKTDNPRDWEIASKVAARTLEQGVPGFEKIVKHRLSKMAGKPFYKQRMELLSAIMQIGRCDLLSTAHMNPKTLEIFAVTPTEGCLALMKEVYDENGASDAFWLVLSYSTNPALVAKLFSQKKEETLAKKVGFAYLVAYSPVIIESIFPNWNQWTKKLLGDKITLIMNAKMDPTTQLNRLFRIVEDVHDPLHHRELIEFLSYHMISLMNTVVQTPFLDRLDIGGIEFFDFFESFDLSAIKKIAESDVSIEDASMLLEALMDRKEGPLLNDYMRASKSRIY